MLFSRTYQKLVTSDPIFTNQRKYSYKRDTTKYSFRLFSIDSSTQKPACGHYAKGNPNENAVAFACASWRLPLSRTFAVRASIVTGVVVLVPGSGQGLDEGSCAGFLRAALVAAIVVVLVVVCYGSPFRFFYLMRQHGQCI